MGKLGRPSRAERERRVYMVCAHVNHAQHWEVLRAARAAHISVSEFVLRAVLSALQVSVDR